MNCIERLIDLVKDKKDYYGENYIFSVIANAVYDILWDTRKGGTFPIGVRNKLASLTSRIMERDIGGEILLDAALMNATAALLASGIQDPMFYTYLEAKLSDGVSGSNMNAVAVKQHTLNMLLHGGNIEPAKTDCELLKRIAVLSDIYSSELRNASRKMISLITKNYPHLEFTAALLSEITAADNRENSNLLKLVFSKAVSCLSNSNQSMPRMQQTIWRLFLRGYIGNKNDRSKLSTAKQQTNLFRVISPADDRFEYRSDTLAGFISDTNQSQELTYATKLDIARQLISGSSRNTKVFDPSLILKISMAHDTTGINFGNEPYSLDSSLFVAYQVFLGELSADCFLSNYLEYTVGALFRNIEKKLIEYQGASSTVIEVIRRKTGILKYSREIIRTSNYNDLVLFQRKNFDPRAKNIQSAIDDEIRRISADKHKMSVGLSVKHIDLPERNWTANHSLPFIRIGLLQPRANPIKCLLKGKKKTLSSDIRDFERYETLVKQDLAKALPRFESEVTNLIIMPEIYITENIRKLLLSWCGANRIGAIFGDFYDTRRQNGRLIVRNGYSLIWPTDNYRCLCVRGWKHSLSNSEKVSFENNSYSFIPGHDLSLFHTRSFGDLAILICFDLMRIETLSFLKGSIHHLFVPAYNRDLETFKGLAETIVKTCFSNVVIANTGEYGGSVARAPYYDNHLREVATVMGNRLFEALVFDLPVESLARYRKHDNNFDNSISDKNKDLYNGGKGRIFKSLPPDFDDRSSFSSSD